MTLEKSSADGAQGAFVIAAVVGTVHGLFSIYWGFGGTWLVNTLGHDLVELWQRYAVLLVPVGVVKVLAALLPLVLVKGSADPVPRWHRGLRYISWAGAVLLIFWGGVNTVTGNLVLGGVVVPDGGYDRVGMIGHAWLWDPLFLLWGVALGVGLWLSRRGTVTGRRAPAARH
ncbi:DUF3995 domain-containing protein [Corynebacterium sp. AOP40-9SA-29]|uniref:DUF3995 domain-containing protein n=1 Tax=Corynebacterium sp. AOP40-9SA-29 TaxID=3457677 RepID=UPI004033563C